MLQRAASNAYSWWWASHIRTKQSKWLEQNLQDMEEKVQSVLRLIEEDGDSFAKRAEMYYKKRPELISFVEESYRAYRALADRYDHMSTELQNANNTIAYVFPEQVQFAMEEDDEEAASSSHAKKAPESNKANVPKVPKIPKELKGLVPPSVKKMRPKKERKEKVSPAARSGMTKAEGMKEIERAQKQILALQTEKEFVKSSYESGLAKFWEIDEQIRDMQEKVSALEDEFGPGIVIEDDEARALMAAVALKSCNDTLTELTVRQKMSAEDAGKQRERIEDARERIKLMKKEILDDEMEEKGRRKEEDENDEEKQRLENLREKIKEQFEVNTSFTVTELAEKIDDLVSKVVSLETAVSSQAALIERLKKETADLHAQIKMIEGEKSEMATKDDMIGKLRELEEQIDELQRVNTTIEEQNKNLTAHFTAAHCSLDHLSTQVGNAVPNTEEEVKAESQEEKKEKEEVKTETQEEKTEKNEKYSSKSNLGELLNMKTEEEKEDEPDWKQLFMNGMDDKERALLTEYTAVLRNFKDAKKKLNERENNGGKSLFDVTVQLMKLKDSNAKKDQQIQNLKQKVRLLQQGSAGAESELVDVKELVITPPEKTSEIEEKFRSNIDELLEENLEFWLRFSTTFQQIQKFDVEVKDLQSESAQLEEKIKKQEGSSTPRLSLKSDAKPLYKHLREVHAMLTIWIEKSSLLKEELKSRFSSLCDIQEEITSALKESAEDEDFRFTSYQAAKFQGEILNMKQENNKVADELQAGLDHVTSLQLEVERSLAKLNEKFKLSGSKNNPSIQLHSESRSRVPLRSFIFGIKAKKQRNSIFSSIHPILYRRYHGQRLNTSKAD